MSNEAKSHAFGSSVTEINIGFTSVNRSTAFQTMSLWNTEIDFLTAGRFQHRKKITVCDVALALL